MILRLICLRFQITVALKTSEKKSVICVFSPWVPPALSRAGDHLSASWYSPAGMQQTPAEDARVAILTHYKTKRLSWILFISTAFPCVIEMLTRKSEPNKIKYKKKYISKMNKRTCILKLNIKSSNNQGHFLAYKAQTDKSFRNIYIILMFRENHPTHPQSFPRTSPGDESGTNTTFSPLVNWAQPHSPRGHHSTSQPRHALENPAAVEIRTPWTQFRVSNTLYTLRRVSWRRGWRRRRSMVASLIPRPLQHVPASPRPWELGVVRDTERKWVSTSLYTLRVFLKVWLTERTFCGGIWDLLPSPSCYLTMGPTYGITSSVL